MDARELLKEIARRIDASGKETREYVDTAVRSSAQETREYVDTAVRSSAQETRKYVDTAARELRVVVEDSQRPIRMIADGHAMLAEKLGELAVRMERVEGRLDRTGVEIAAFRAETHADLEALRGEMRAGDAGLREEISTLRSEMRAGDASLREELREFRTEVRGELAEVRRVSRLEATVGDLATRVGRLEDRSAP